MQEPYFQEDIAAGLFERWNALREMDTLDALLRYCAPIVSRLIATRRANTFDPEDELTAVLLLRLSNGFQRLYDPAKGRVFSFVTRVCQSGLIDIARRRRRVEAHWVPLDGPLLNRLSTNGHEHAETLDDIRHRIMSVKTLSTCPLERDAQKWLVKSLLASNFVYRRHEAANCMMVVYGISATRSRRLYDLTLLAVRRALIDERKLKPVRNAELAGTRSKCLLRYREALTDPEFARLTYLMKNLALGIIENGEFTLSEVLWGSPREMPLFP